MLCRVILHRPHRALASLAEVDYPQERIEVIVAEGRQPSHQRNEAAKRATGEIIYFLDNDSEADIDLFRFAARSFKDEKTAVVGGPSEILPSDKFFPKCFGFSLGSYFGTTNVRCRYKSIGRSERIANEHHLILCNMGVRREVFAKSGGFDERLYPNEENEFLNRLNEEGHQLVYNLRAIVRRPHRTSFAKFVRQMLIYGRGRTDHFLLHPSFFSPLHTVPLLFALYFVSLAFFHPLWYFAPLLLYLLADGMAALRIVVDEEDLRVALVVPVLFPTIHFAYAGGMVWGLLKRGSHRIRRPIPVDNSDVRITWTKTFEAETVSADKERSVGLIG